MKEDVKGVKKRRSLRVSYVTLVYHKNEQRTVRAKRINMMNESERRAEERCETEKRDYEDERTAVHCKTYIH